jgi:hypothetical protein
MEPRTAYVANGADKLRHTLETLLHRMRATRRGVGKQTTVKMLIALLTLQERYVETRNRLRKNGYERLTCNCKSDRMVLTTQNPPWRVLEDLDYRSRPPQRLWNRNYRLVSRLKGKKSIREINVEHEPNAAWLSPYRITIIPGDDTGVEVQDFRSIQEILPDFKIVVMEIAFDFPIDSVVDVAYVRRHLLSGKMRLPLGTDVNLFHQRWGRAAASKADRVYTKWNTSKLRLELELHARFLRQHKIVDIFDFRRLIEILIPHHIFFAQLRTDKLIERLRRNAVAAREIRNVLHAVKKREDSLWETLQYLRRTVHLKNVRRLLLPISEMNQVVEQGLRTWAAQWPTSATRLGKEK